MRAYAAVPSEAGAASAAIVLAMHLYGVDGSIRELARQFAREGFAVIVPDLYARFDAPSGDGCADPSVFLPFAKRLTFDTVDPDIRASAQWLSQNCPRAKRAIAGVCMGGIMALHRSAGYSDVFSAAAVWYGSIERANVEPKAVDIPIVGSYGGADDGIPTAHVESFRKLLSVPNDILRHRTCRLMQPNYVNRRASASAERSRLDLQ